MSCPICDNKPANCDCTPGDLKAHELETKVEYLCTQNDELIQENEDLTRKGESLCEQNGVLLLALHALCTAAERTLKHAKYPPHTFECKDANDQTLHQIHLSRALLRMGQAR